MLSASERTNICAQAHGLMEFLLRMLRFHPSERSPPGELLSDPWLVGDLPAPPPELCELSSRKRRRSSAGMRTNGYGAPDDPASGTDQSPASAAGDRAAESNSAARGAAPAPLDRSSPAADACAAEAAASPTDDTCAAVAADGASASGNGAARAGHGEAPDREAELEGAPRLAFSAPPALAGGDDARAAALARGFDDEPADELARYAVALREFEAHTLDGPRTAAAWLGGDNDVADGSDAAIAADLYGLLPAGRAGGLFDGGASNAGSEASGSGGGADARPAGGLAPLDLVDALQQADMTPGEIVDWIHDQREAGQMTREDLASCLSIIRRYRDEVRVGSSGLAALCARA